MIIRVLICHFTLVLIKINYVQIGDQTGLFYTTSPVKAVFYTGGNKWFLPDLSWFFLLVPSENRNTRSTSPTSVFTGIGQMLMSRPATYVLSFAGKNFTKIKQEFTLE